MEVPDMLNKIIKVHLVKQNKQLSLSIIKK